MDTFRRMILTGLLLTSTAGLLGPSTAAADNIDLYALGKVVYTTGSESCLTCHGSDGNGTSALTLVYGTPKLGRPSSLNQRFEAPNLP